MLPCPAQPCIPPRLRVNRSAPERTELTKAAAVLAIALALPRAADAQVAEVQVTPARLALEVGKRTALYAAAYDRQGNLVPGTDFVFASSDTLVARVSATGAVMAVGPGSTTIEARAGTRRGAASVTVTGPADPRGGIASLTMEPASLSLLPLEPARLAVRALRRDGSSGDAAGIAWRSLDPKVAQVDAFGLVVGIAPGGTMIEASVAGVSATVPVAVDTAVFTTPERRALAPGAIDTLFASVPAQGGRRLAAGLTWRSADPAIVRVGAAGDIVAAGTGETEVIVTGYGMTGRIRVVVRKPVAAFTLNPRASSGPVAVPLGTSRRFEARAEAADSTPIPDLPIVWAVADTTIARFDPATGMLASHRAGTTTLTARLEGFQPIMWTIDVASTRVVLDRRRLGIGVGAQARLTPGLAEAGGAAVAGPAPALAWTSDRPGVATVQDGAIEAISLGRALITATAPWGASAAAEVCVAGDLLAASDRGGTFGIYQVRLGPVPSLTPLAADGSISLQPVFSPDRTRIAFTSNRSGSFDIYVMDADGGAPRRLTSDPGTENDPAWTPDGTRIVYTTAAGAKAQIAVVGIDGAGARVLTSAPRGNQSPAVAPDGRSIAFTSSRDGNSEVYQMDLDGTNPRRLTTTREAESLPRFLPGGDLVYVVDGDGDGAVIVRHAAGAPIRLVATTEPVAALAVDADGSRLAYVTGRAGGRRGRTAGLRLFVQRMTGDAAPTPVPGGAGEQITTPSF